MVEKGLELKDSTNSILEKLLEHVAEIDTVEAIGISGTEFIIPEPGEGDIDIFVYCKAIPDMDQRRKVLEDNIDLLKEIRLDCFSGGHWGNGDFASINGVDTWFMYFSSEDTLKNIEDILNGYYPDKLDNYYYPVGRCAMLKTITIMYEKNKFLSNLKSRLLEYPESLSRKLVSYHLESLQDLEDLERASMRGDVLFYHVSLDNAIDHFLQALFAANYTFFPSRKRSITFMESFKIKPENCEKRLLKTIKLGCDRETLVQSLDMWIALTKELADGFEA